MRYYIIAGEASGDLHASNCIKEIRKLDPAAVIRGWGGDMMQAAGTDLVKHYRHLAFMGFIEVIKNLPAILRNLSFCKADISAFKPDVLVLVDYPGFNLRIAAWAKPQGFKIAWYISPQIWAWKENRVHKIKKYVDRMLVILPFEKTFYKKWQYEVEYVGHPLIEVVDHARRQPLAAAMADKPIIALLPGSREQEILKKLPVMLAVSQSFPGYQFIVAKAPGLDSSFYDALLAPYTNVSFVSGQTYTLLQQASAALVTSGTATLETALFGVPEVVCYKSSNISYQIGKRLIKVKYISLVNLIMDKPVVKELIQYALTPANLERELNDLLHNNERKAALQEDYRQLKNLLGEGGDASANAARAIVDLAAG
jgi:lipid-A-disaccharide synthase